MSVMFNPPHPGQVFKSSCLDDGFSISEAARALNVPRAALSEFVNGRRGVSPRLAMKIAAVFGGSAEHWLRMQAAYDLWQVRQEYDASDVRPLHNRKVLSV